MTKLFGYDGESLLRFLEDGHDWGIGFMDNGTRLAQPGATMMQDTKEGNGDDNGRVDNNCRSCAIQELCRGGLRQKRLV